MKRMEAFFLKEKNDVDLVLQGALEDVPLTPAEEIISLAERIRDGDNSQSE